MKIFFINYKKMFMFIIIMLIIIFLLYFYFCNKNTEQAFSINNNIYYKGNVDEKIIAFTCNVDWGNEYIPIMLEIFKENNIKITFFVTGRWAQKYPELLLEIHKEGHEIGNHGYLHRNYGCLSYDLNKNEILKAEKIIRKITNYKTKYFAPPSGDFNENTIKAAEDLGYKIILWDVDTIDWRKDSTKDKIINRVINKASKSSIVLMHPKDETVKSLPYIITYFNKNKYSIGKVSDIIK